MKQERSVDGVVISEETIRQSEEHKRQHRTVRQTQVYRDVANLKYLIIRHMGNAPRKYAKYFDEMLATVSNAKQSLALGLIGRDPEQQYENMSYAQVMVEDIQDDATILHQLELIDKKEKKSIRSLAQKIAAQIVRLRDYYKGQGIDMNGKTCEP
jgi:polysaccharide pyruvyl transferase WcaK-like protein